MKNLVGRVINSVTISKNRNLITFNTDQGPIHYYTEGDCCSSSWIEHFEYEGIEGSTVISFTEKNIEPYKDDLIPTLYPDNQQEYDQWYFYDIVTTKGTFTIEMRNSSNGYYGGYLIYLSDHTLNTGGWIKENM